jgi:hypothetical protein
MEIKAWLRKRVVADWSGLFMLLTKQILSIKHRFSRRLNRHNNIRILAPGLT